MPTCIYIPISTPEMQHVAKTWNDGRVAQNKAAYHVIANNTSGNMKAVRRTVATGLLEKLTAADKLYVLSHGMGDKTSVGALVIGNDRGGTLYDPGVGGVQVIGGMSKQYTCAKFARHLEEEGLTKTFVDLRLFCCCTALPAKYNGNVLAPYASRLKGALHNLQYLQITVTGYLGDVAPYGNYYKPGSKERDPTTKLGMGPTVSVAGEYTPMNFKDHAVKF